jgi:hypothetical protein
MRYNELRLLCINLGLGELAEETAKYAFPRRYEAKNLEEALMSGILFFLPSCLVDVSFYSIKQERCAKYAMLLT